MSECIQCGKEKPPQHFAYGKNVCRNCSDVATVHGLRIPIKDNVKCLKCDGVFKSRNSAKICPKCKLKIKKSR
jgi:Zn finger protein HypA/HybF involved in hydrogenase expression